MATTGSMEHTSSPRRPSPEMLQLALRKLIPILLIAYIFSFLDRTNIGFAKEALEIDVGISAAAYGVGAGLFFLAYAALEIPSNLMLHRVGARYWITRIMVTWGIIAALMALVNGPISFYVLRVLLGAAEAGLYPGAVYIISLWWPQEERARIQGIFLVGACIASIIGGPMAGGLLLMDGLAGFHGWQWMFVIMGFPAALYAIVVWLYLPDRPTKARWLDAETAEEWEKFIAAENEAGVQQSGNHGLRNVIKDSQILFAILAYFTNQLGLYAVVFFLPSILSIGAPSLSSFYIGLLVAVPWVLAAIGVIIIPGQAAKDLKPKKWMLISTGGMAIGLVIAALGSPWIAFAGYCLVGLCFLAPQPLYFAHVSARLQGSLLAAGLAAVNTFGILGGFFGPTLMGFMEQATGTQQAGLWLVIVIQIFGLVMIGLLKPHFATESEIESAASSPSI